MLRADYLIGLAKSITAHGHSLFVGGDEVKLPDTAFQRNALTPLADLRAVMPEWRQERLHALLLQIPIRLPGVGATESATGLTGARHHYGPVKVRSTDRWRARLG